MEVSGEYLIAADRDAVWNAMNDPEVLRKCIPGCEGRDAVNSAICRSLSSRAQRDQPQ